MKLVGLTGGIGCGKTTVLETFRHLGIPCFVADQRAGEYYKEPAFLNEIRVLFGDRVFDDNGNVVKSEIARIVFNDKDKLQKINSLIHPRVMQEFVSWAELQKAPYVIMESAIIYEYNLDSKLDTVIAVYLEKEERLRRLQLRDNVSRDALEARMRNQISAEEKMDRADYVILNYEGNPRARQVEYVDRLLRI
jgi:dephospho-CoA kinase